MKACIEKLDSYVVDESIAILNEILDNFDKEQPLSTVRKCTESEGSVYISSTKGNKLIIFDDLDNFLAEIRLYTSRQDYPNTIEYGMRVDDLFDIKENISSLLKQNPKSKAKRTPKLPE